MEAIKITDFDDITHKLSENGWTFAFYAVAHNNFIILDYLIYHPKFNINIVDNFGNSLLMIAIIFKNINIANYLIRCNINKYIINYYGHSAYDIYLKNGCFGIIQF
jgi:ankyrin repeat protein